MQALRVDPRTSGVPVIMLSARAGEESQAENMPEGADDYLMKPFSARALLARVAVHLKLGRMRREASEALQASEQQHRLLFEQTADGFFLADAAGRYVDVNTAGCEMLGYSREKVAFAFDEYQPVDEANLAPPMSSLCILVADDNADSAEILAMLLTLKGYDMKTAHDGDAALDVAATFRPDVILLDIGMPKLNGYEVCRRIRQQAWGKSIKVIAMTGWGQEDDRCKSHAAGFDFHLVKPVELDALYQLLAGVTGKVSCNSVHENKLVDDSGRNVILQKQAPLQLNQTQEKLRQLQKVEATGQQIDGVAHDLNNLLQIISADLHLIMKQGAASSDIEKRVNNAQEAVKRGAKLTTQLLAFSLGQVQCDGFTSENII